MPSASIWQIAGDAPSLTLTEAHWNRHQPVHTQPSVPHAAAMAHTARSVDTSGGPGCGPGYCPAHGHAVPDCRSWAHDTTGLATASGASSYCGPRAFSSQAASDQHDAPCSAYCPAQQPPSATNGGGGGTTRHVYLGGGLFPVTSTHAAQMPCQAGGHQNMCTSGMSSGALASEPASLPAGLGAGITGMGAGAGTHMPCTSAPEGVYLPSGLLQSAYTAPPASSTNPVAILPHAYAPRPTSCGENHLLGDGAFSADVALDVSDFPPLSLPSALGVSPDGGVQPLAQVRFSFSPTIPFP